jgi:hypothetical protein
VKPVPKQQQAPTPDRKLALLSEIGAGTSRHESRDSTEAVIARLSANPILLHRYLREITEVPKDIELDSRRKLLSCLSATADVFVSRTAGRPRPYHVVEPVQAESLQPEAFVATEEDIAMAVEYFAPPLHGFGVAREPYGKLFANLSRGRSRLLLWGILVGACLVGIMIW